MAVDRAVKFVVGILIAGILLVMASKYLYVNEQTPIEYQKIYYDNYSGIVEQPVQMPMHQAEAQFPLLKLVNIVLLFALIGLPTYLIRRADITGAVMGVVSYLIVLITEPLWMGQMLTLWNLGGLYQILAIIFVSAVLGGIASVITFRDSISLD